MRKIRLESNRRSPGSAQGRGRKEIGHADLRSDQGAPSERDRAFNLTAGSVEMWALRRRRDTRHSFLLRSSGTGTSSARKKRVPCTPYRGSERCLEGKMTRGTLVDLARVLILSKSLWVVLEAKPAADINSLWEETDQACEWRLANGL